MRCLMRTSYAVSYAEFQARLMQRFMRSLMLSLVPMLSSAQLRSFKEHSTRYIIAYYIYPRRSVAILVKRDLIETVEIVFSSPSGKTVRLTEVLCMSYAEPYAVLCGASTGLRAKWRPKPCPEETRIPTMSYAECYARPKAHKTFQKSCFRVYVLCAFDPA